MKPHNWISDLESGLSALDSDHKQLLDKVNRLNQISAETNISKLKSALLDMKSAMSVHFAREERMMNECKYEFTSEHVDEHQRLLADIQGELEAVEAFEHRVSSFGDFAHRWVSQHISGKDSLFDQSVLTQASTTDRRHKKDENFDTFEERRLENLEAIRWPTDISTGIEAIDKHYPAMINLLNQIIAARKSSDRGRLAILFERFGDATASHFCAEEEMMSRIDLELQAAHREAHRLLLEEFSHLIDDWRSNKISADSLCRFIYRWMLHHIAASDIPLGAALSRC